MHWYQVDIDAGVVAAKQEAEEAFALRVTERSTLAKSCTAAKVTSPSAVSAGPSI
jgi:hypothetical protein